MKPCKTHASIVLAMLPLLGVAAGGTLERARGILIPMFEAKGESAISVLVRITDVVQMHDPAKKALPIHMSGFISPKKRMRPITMHVRKVSAEELIRKYCQAAELQCRFDQEGVAIGEALRPLPATAKESATRRRARQIILPHFIAEEVALPEVVARIRIEARKHDPEKKGLNILLRLSEAERNAEMLIDLELRNVSVEQILAYCCRPFGLRCEFGEDAVVIGGRGLAGAGMGTPVRRLAPGVVPAERKRPRPKRIDWGN